MSDSDELPQSEISSLHASLLLECENLEPIFNTHSAPSTPVLVRRSAFGSRSLESSPTSLRSGVRTSSVKDLIQTFEIPKFSNMADKAMSEAASWLSKISHAKKWVTRSLHNLESALVVGGDNKIDHNMNKIHSDQLLTQQEKIVTCEIAIEDIYI